MRKSKIVTLEGRGEITVKEVTPRSVLNALQPGDLSAQIRALFADAVDYQGDLLELYPSELELIVAALFEVNAGFFGIAERLRLTGVIGDVAGIFQAQLRRILPEAFAASYRQAIKTSGDTAGTSS